MSNERLKFTGNTIEIGRERYNFTQETQQLLIPGFRSPYPKDTSVLIINEPHDSSEGHYNLYKGLTSFFKANPGLARETIFLSEGTEAEKPISMQELIAEEPNPSDQIIRQILQTLTITGYMAYEWKTHQGIPIIGTEDQGLYELSRRFASLCRENPNALFQSIKYKDGTSRDIPLVYGWGFAVSARNKRIAQTLIDKVKKYKNPVLFVGAGHMKDPRPPQVAEAMDSFIKGRLIDAQYMGIQGAFQFPWSNAGNNWWLYRNVNNDTETYDIEHYLRQARIGYTFLDPKGYDVTSQEDEENYKRIFRLQRE
jgi:hypothetical protein